MELSAAQIAPNFNGFSPTIVVKRAFEKRTRVYIGSDAPTKGLTRNQANGAFDVA
jgi:hypothetical protein